MRLVERRMLRQAQPAERPVKRKWWDVALNMAGVPIVTASLGFFVGVLAEGRQEESYERRLFLEQRMKLFISTATNFNSYLENQDRLVVLSGYLAGTNSAPNVEQQERLARFEKDRNTAREKLWADLEQAQLFFTPKVGERVASFRTFYQTHRSGTLDTLPAGTVWANHKDRILSSMRDEVNGARR